MGGVNLDRLFEATQGAAVIALGVAKMSSLEIVPVGVQVLDPRSRRDEGRRRRELDFDGFDDTGGDLILDREDVVGFTVETARASRWNRSRQSGSDASSVGRAARMPPTVHVPSLAVIGYSPRRAAGLLCLPACCSDD